MDFPLLLIWGAVLQFKPSKSLPNKSCRRTCENTHLQSTICTLYQIKKTEEKEGVSPATLKGQGVNS